MGVETKKIKVCHMTSAHTNDDVRIFHKQCTSLAKAGYDTYLVAQGETFDKSGVHIVGVPKIGGGRLARMTQGAKSVYKKALEIDADIYQIHDPELLPYALKLKKKGKKVIFDSHECYAIQIAEKYYIPKCARKIIAMSYIVYQKKILQRIEAVIFPCTLEGKNPFEGIAKQTIFINNVPLLEEFYDKYDKESIAMSNICYVGGLTYSRGITYLIKATASTKVKLVLGGSYMPKEYEEALKKLNEYSCVDYRGFCSRETVLDIYRNTSIGMCTVLNIGQYNKGDNLATKVYEYMSMGLPVILTDCSYAKEVNGKYNCFICVDPQSINEIAEAVNYLIDNPEIAKIMGSNGRRAIREEFNWNIEEKKLLDLYEGLW